MRITRVKTFICNSFRTNWVFVKIETDSAGLHGWGEATLEYLEPTVVAAIHDLESYLIGKDPANIEAFRHDCYRDAYWRGGPVLMSALAGVEMALWDIKGKSLGVPVWQLFGGKVRDSVPVYVNGWFAPARTPEEFAEKALSRRGSRSAPSRILSPQSLGTGGKCRDASTCRLRTEFYGSGNDDDRRAVPQ